jgi:mannose-6-phosphate isomerase-like protein (cupin superfamily)
VSGIVVADISVPGQVATLGELLSRWEPRLELLSGDDECRIYEPDGTFYGICLCDEVTLTVRHKPRVLSRGDAFVVPAGVSVDVDPPFRFVAIRHDGVPPNHFRERFIQTWGLDHRAVDAAKECNGVIEVLADEPLRYRFAYRIVKCAGSASSIKTEWSAHLILGLEGEGVIQSQGLFDVALRPNNLAWIPPGMTYNVTGPGRVGILTLDLEVVYEGKRLKALTDLDHRASPEYHPDDLPETNN